VSVDECRFEDEAAIIAHRQDQDGIAMARRLPPLNALRAFEAVARHQSISAAADELCVTHSAVSRHVAKLEDHLGAKLFTREHQRLTLNSRGAAYAAQLTQLFDAMQSVTAENFGEVPGRTPLHVGVYPTYANRVLIPRLSRFQQEFPDIPFHIETWPGLPDPRHLDVDLAIVLGTGNWADLIAEELCPEELLPVASPKLLGGRVLNSANDLKEFTLLHAVPRLNDWEQWFKLMGISDINAYRGMRFDTSGMAYQAAINELGVAMAQTTYIQDDIEQGRLVALFDSPLKTERSYYAVYSREKRADRRILAFTHWLKSEFSGTLAHPEMAS
jgi:LysR family transcriptional regulator, glycine cleavage system transcriptional activator